MKSCYTTGRGYDLSFGGNAEAQDDRTLMVLELNSGLNPES